MNRSLSNARRRSRSGFVSVAGVLLILIVFALVAVVMEAWSLALWSAGLAVLLFVLVGNGPAVRWLAGRLQPAAFFEPPRDFRGASAIVLMGDGTLAEPGGGVLPRWLAYSRIECAARLYRAAMGAGGAPCVIVTGDDSDDASERTSTYAERLQALGVRVEDITMERRGRNSYRQAELTAKILRAGRYDRIFLVTSGLHMKRALRYFGHFGVQPTPVASDFVTVPVWALPRGENFAIAEIAIHQHVGLARLWVYNVLGLNKRPGAQDHSAAGTNS